MTNIEELRAKATHARRLAEDITDTHAKAALHAYADELDLQAAALERPQST